MVFDATAGLGRGNVMDKTPIKIKRAAKHPSRVAPCLPAAAPRATSCTEPMFDLIQPALITTFPYSLDVPIIHCIPRPVN